MAAAPPKLSLCLIARDEEANLPRCLASAAGWVDEIVLVDTGSRDRTVAVAREYGARVFHEPWRADFALHRNQGIERARGAGALVLDADEELAPAGREFLRGELGRGGADLWEVEILHLAADGGHGLQFTPRLLRRASGARFTGAIHERVAGRGLRVGRAPLRLIHHGFAQGAEVMAQKAKRNLELVRAWREREPRGPDAAIYLAQTLMVDPAPGEATLRAPEEAHALALAAGAPARLLPRAYHPLLMALTRLGRFAELAARARECLRRLPGYPDPLFSLAFACHRLGQPAGVIAAARRFRELQAHWREHPGDYPYPHNLSLHLLPRVLGLWLAAARSLGREEEARQVMAWLGAGPAGEPAAAPPPAGEGAAPCPPSA